MIVKECADERGEYLVVTPVINCGKSFLIDASDRACLAHRWGVYWSQKALVHYVVGNVGGKTLIISRFLMGEPAGMTVDHIDGDKMLNRRYNLRVCTERDNLRNRRPKRISSTGYRGVYPASQGGYNVIVQTDGRRMHFYGHYDDVIEAAKARDAIVLAAFGEFANLNFPQP